MRIYQTIASKRQKELAAKQAIEPPRDLFETMLSLSPHLQCPNHLLPYAKLLEKAQHETVDVVVATPPQVGKTTTALHALIMHSKNVPGKIHCYSSYSATRSREVAKEFIQLATIAGLGPHSANECVYLNNNTKIKFVGIGGGLTGNPITGLHIMDDLIKGWRDSQSSVMRDDIWNWILSVADTRRHQGSSNMIIATRWHMDDPSGRAIKRRYDHIRLPAICDSYDDLLGRQIGDPIWPDKFPLEMYEEARKNKYVWDALYQGNPRPRGDVLFSGEPQFYTDFPDDNFSLGNGVDLSYSKKTRADYSVLLSGRKYGGNIYITNMIRRQCQAPEFTKILISEYKKNPSPMLWQGSGTELGSAQFIQSNIRQFIFLPALLDKYMRPPPSRINIGTLEGFFYHGGRIGWRIS